MSKITESARDQDCLVQLPGVCTHDTAKTIWSHYRGWAGGKGMGTKSHDLCGAYCCTACDAVYDGQAPRPSYLSKASVDLLWLEGHIRSLARLIERGVISP